MSTPELEPETPITDELFGGLVLKAPIDWLNGLNKMAKHARKLESALNAAREALSDTQRYFAVKKSHDNTLSELRKAKASVSVALAQIDEALSPQQSKTT